MNEVATIELRNLEIEDYLDLRVSMQKAYPDWQTSVWSEEHIRKLLEVFPEGQIFCME